MNYTNPQAPLTADQYEQSDNGIELQVFAMCSGEDCDTLAKSFANCDYVDVLLTKVSPDGDIETIQEHDYLIDRETINATVDKLEKEFNTVADYVQYC